MPLGFKKNGNVRFLIMIKMEKNDREIEKKALRNDSIVKDMSKEM